MNQKIMKGIFTFTLVCLMFGCGGEEIQYPEPSQNTKDSTFSIRSGTFSYGDEECKADYGMITVPENRENTDSRPIYLPVIRIRARSENPQEPIFCLAGGPGESNMNWMPIDTLLQNHDFVMVGYRGVDGSTVLNCPEVTEVLREENNPLSKDGMIRIGNAWRTSFDRFRSGGIDLDGYTIPECIKDLEQVRRVLNYDKINLISESYGTRIAYLYGLMFPESINRSVMVAVNPPGHCMWQPEMTDKQLKYYAKLWSQDSLRNIESTDLASTMQNVLNNLPDTWLVFPISKDKVRITTFCLLFHRSTAAMVFDAYVAAERGDYSGIALLSLAYDFVLPSLSVWGDLATKAVTADYNPNKNYPLEPSQNLILGAPLDEVLWGPLSYAQLPIKMIPDSLRKLQYSDVETLLISGSVDYSCPPDYAKNELLPYLPKGKHIILSEYGHVGDLRYLNQYMSDIIMASFINTGIADTSQTSYVPMDFNVDLGLPTIAKLALGGIAFLIILLILIAYLIYRKVKRKKLTLLL